MARAPLALLLLVLCLVFAFTMSAPCSAKDEQKRFPEIDDDARIGPSGRAQQGVALDNGGSGAGRVFGVSQAPADTFYYGGTVWDAADGRWEAAAPSGAGWANRNMWTWSANGFGGVPHSGLNMDGWTGLVQNSDAEDRFHVQSSAEIGACVIAGQKSLFCGLTNPECGEQCYVDLVGTGYGNFWNQYVASPRYTFDAGDQIALGYDCRYQSEASYDFTYVILQTWRTADSTWVDRDTLRVYSGAASATESLDIDALMTGLTPPVDFRIVFNFRSDGMYSDADGLNSTTCGAFALDTYVLEDNGIVFAEDFESTSVSALPAGWQRFSMGVGDFAMVKHLDELAVPLSEDPCMALTPGMCRMADSVLALFDPSAPSYPHPLNQYNFAVSPVIDLSAHSGLGGMLFTFDRFAKLNLDNHVFYIWQVRYVPACESGGSSAWLTDNYPYYSPEGASCATISFDVSALIPAGAEDVQIALGVFNGCDEWAWYGCETCNETPYFDNVTFGVYGTGTAPYVAMREVDYWQDQFAEDGTLDPESTADSRTPNYLTSLNPPIFGDTLVCRANADDAEIYFVFRLAAKGPGQNLTHPFFTTWFPGVANGSWIEARMDTAEVTTSAGNSTAPSPGYWMCAFHESDPVAIANGLPEGTEIIPNNVFVPGTRIEYFLKSKYIGSSDYFLLPDTTGGRCEEFEILPMMRGSAYHPTWPCLLVADHFGGRGFNKERNADRIARHLNAGGIEFDIYNKLGPTLNLRNGIGRGSANPGQVGQPGDDQYCTPPGATAAQMQAYNFCILNAGNVYGYSVCEPDAALFTTWLDSGYLGYMLKPRFLWLSGDLIARELNRRTPWGPTFLNSVLCAKYVSPSYWTASGDATYCLPMDGVPGARLAHDALKSFTLRTNNCPRRQYGLNVLGLSTSGVCSGEAAGGDTCGVRAEAQFHADYGGGTEIAAVSNVKMMSCWTRSKTFLEGYDFCLVRSDDSQGPPDCGPDDFLGAWLDSVLTWGGHGPGLLCEAVPEDLWAPPSQENSDFVWQNTLCDSTRLLFCPGCPREGIGQCDGSSLRATIRDQFGLPISLYELCLQLESPDSSVYMCSAVRGLTDQNAQVELKIPAGLRQATTSCSSVEVRVYGAYNWLLYDDTLVVLSPDYNGDSLVDNADSLVFAADYGTSACRSDFNCDGIVGASDWTIFLTHYGHGCPSAVVGVGEKPGVSAPPVTALEQNFPNPFNPSTGIRLSVREAGRVVLRVRDIAGRTVRTLVDDWREPGVYLIGWDGRDEGGRPVASGVYFYSLVTSDERVTRKMVLVR